MEWFNSTKMELEWRKILDEWRTSSSVRSAVTLVLVRAKERERERENDDNEGLPRFIGCLEMYGWTEETPWQNFISYHLNNHSQDPFRRADWTESAMHPLLCESIRQEALSNKAQEIIIEKETKDLVAKIHILAHSHWTKCLLVH